MTTVEDRLKAWAAPIMMGALLIMAGSIWKMQQDRIGVLELQASATSNSLAAITENQKNSLADRSDFQAATTVRLDRMADTLTSVGQSLAALTALQQAQTQAQQKP